MTKDLVKIPSLELAQRFNAWQLSGYVPKRCKTCVTTLIPKQNHATKPEDFRPITMAPTLLRLFHRILSKRMMALLPFDEHQEAFQKSDGVAYNLITIQSQMEYHKKAAKSKKKTKCRFSRRQKSVRFCEPYIAFHSM